MKKSQRKTIQNSGFYAVQPVSYKRQQRKKSIFGSFLFVVFLLLIACCCVIVTVSIFRHLTARQHTFDSSFESLAYSSPSPSSTVLEQQQNWSLILVNRDHPLPDDYAFETITLDSGEQIDSRIYPSLQKMFDDMRADGVYPVVASGFRTYQKQAEIMQQKIEAYCAQGYPERTARELAEDWVAAPGTSEHQTGLAVDINGDGTRSTSDEVYGWLLEHAHEYGFIQRYPAGKSEITGILNEPWHYRYVGLSDAAQIKQSGLCLEEYLSQG